MPRTLPTFWLKVLLAAGVALAADQLLFGASVIGLNLALVALALAAALVLARPAVRKNRLGLAGLGAAAIAIAIMADRPSLLTALLFATSIGVATLSPRAPAGGGVVAWAQRLIAAALVGLAGPLLDIRRVLRTRARAERPKLGALLTAAVLPVVGGAVFILLFSAANPVVEKVLGGFRPAPPDVPRLVLAGVFALMSWMALRPRRLRRTLALPAAARDRELPIAAAASVAISLVVFNVIFAVQNALDIAFLWSGARLPGGMTFAEYAHRGAYPLIVTALLAGLFVLVFLRPGSAIASSVVVRRLVIAWIAQNLFLVASTMLRTVDYIDAYSLTRMRIAALLWMGLVGAGLVLIVWRLLRAKSGAWLVNANATVAAAILGLCCVVDLGSVAAAWNVRHAREAGGRGVSLDLAYFSKELHGAGVVALAELEQRPLEPRFRCQVSRYRRIEVAWLAERQTDWRSWRWRDHRRLQRVAALTGESPLSLRTAVALVCPGDRLAPASPLTPPANPRT